MKKTRIIARLDVKGPNVIKGIQFECLRVMGQPGPLAEKYYLQGADELIYLDTVANLYQRQSLINIVNQASESIHIPFTIGGGVRTLEDIGELLRAGADKVFINTAATSNPDLVRQAAETFGSQCIVVSIEACRRGKDRWEACGDNGRQPSGKDVVEWARQVQALGAGEIFLTSVDNEGTELGFDIDLVKRVSDVVTISLIASGGPGKLEDFSQCIKECSVDGVATATLLHYNKFNIYDIKEHLHQKGVNVRRMASAVEGATDPSQDYDIVDYNKFTLSHLQIKDQQEEEMKAVPVSILEKKSSVACDISIINYGLNNVKSVVKAFEQIGRKVAVVDTVEGVAFARCLILPGVGAFEWGMDALHKRGFIEPIKEKVAAGVPFLGICLGMQLLFSESEEFGIHQGLNLIPGKVVGFKRPAQVKERNYKVPHIGWNELKKPSFVSGGDCWEETLLAHTPEHASVYFVHSFFAQPEERACTLATTIYGGQEVCVVAQKGNIVGTQFHPERSGEVGLQILKTFCERNNL